MKALISPNENPIYFISGWVLNPSPSPSSPNKYLPEWSAYPNSCRVAEVVPDDQIFGVAEPLFWFDCADNVVADQFYFDTVNQTINPIVNAPLPSTQGLQTV